MNHLDKDLAVAQTVVLMTSYSFDLQGYTLDQLISRWLSKYHSSWIRLATIEALYLGRYKAISIEQITGVWSRLGSPKVHFGGEFERLICRKLPRHLVGDKNPEKVPQKQVNHSIAVSKEPTNRVPEFYTNSEHLQQDSIATSENHHQFPEESSNLSISEEVEDTKQIISSSLRLEPQTESSTSIKGFTPIPDMSSLFQKLKAIAKPDLNGEQ